ncbi:glycosyltransferase family 2 protein [Pseudaestuariivita sp.]|uniref:glycosyltransferase family 2 protein n=1 Tax=Pseudaestuariivita sp. TaxID=2211669 RepID=UPI00405990F0
MPDPAPVSQPGVSVIVPAHNEGAFLRACLRSVLASQTSRRVECIVVPNGCTDDTEAVARGMTPEFDARGWALKVVTLAKGSKTAALTAGDHAAGQDVRIYLDADVIVSDTLLEALAERLDRTEPAYASGEVEIPRPQSWATRAYRAFYLQVPFMTYGVPGCGLFAMNAAGRARWADWPDIISDDTFARLSFAPHERYMVPHCYGWPLVEGFAALVRVRRRQNAGVDEVAARFPELMRNDDTPGFTRAGLTRAVLRAPVGFAVYAAVALTVRLTRRGATGWSRGR